MIDLKHLVNITNLHMLRLMYVLSLLYSQTHLYTHDSYTGFLQNSLSPLLPPQKKDKNKTKQKNIWINTESIEKHRPCANLSNVCCPKGIPKFLPTQAHLSTPNGCQEKEEIFWKIKISNLGCGRSKGDLWFATTQSVVVTNNKTYSPNGGEKTVIYHNRK